MRYLLVLALLDHEELRWLVRQHEDETGIVMAYSRALVAYGDGDPRPGDLLAVAVRGNAHVLAMLVGYEAYHAIDATLSDDGRP